MLREGKLRGWFLLGIVFLLSGLLLFFSPHPGFASRRLTILHTNDLHSHIEKFSFLATAVERIREEKAQEGEPTILLDSGDFLIGSFYHLLATTHSSELSLMHTLEYEAVTLGNHDFDWGPEALAKIITVAKERNKQSVVPIVSSNIQFSLCNRDDDPLRMLYKKGIIRPYVIKTVSNGLKVGIIGLLGKKAQQEAPGASPLGFVQNPEFVQRRVDEVRKRGVDVVICLSHSGINEDKNLARSVEGIDVIVAGHCHSTTPQPVYVSDTLIVEAGAYANYLGVLQICIEKGKIEQSSYRLVPIGENIPEDKAVKETVLRYKSIVDQQILNPAGLSFDEPVGEVGFNLTKKKGMLDTSLTNLVADAMRFSLNLSQSGEPVDFTFQPTGFIRGSLQKGAVTVSDAFRVLPLGTGPRSIEGYPLVSFYLNAQEIKRILEISLFFALEEDKDYLLQVSGLRFWYNPLRENFSKVTRIEKKDPQTGKYVPLDTRDTDSLYKVGTNLFLFNLFFITRYIPGLVVVPKDKTGAPVSPASQRGQAGAVAGIQKKSSPAQHISEWQAFMRYISHFPDLNGNGLPDIPPRYARPQERINVDIEEISHHYAQKKDPLIGVGAAVLFPSAGHMYTNCWYPKGLFFLGAELGAASFLSHQSNQVRALGLFLLVSLKIIECEDAYESVLEYNRRLDEVLQAGFLLRRGRPAVGASLRF